HVLRVDQIKASKVISYKNSIFDLKNFTPPLEGACRFFIRGLSYVLMKLIQFVGYLFFKKSKVFSLVLKDKVCYFFFIMHLL
ncbi:MAG: hypothetical protein RXO53_07880, partial [Caldisphaera sp.]